MAYVAEEYVAEGYVEDRDMTVDPLVSSVILPDLEVISIYTDVVPTTCGAFVDKGACDV